MRTLADAIAGPDRADEARARFREVLPEASDEAVQLAALVTCAYPALGREVLSRPKDVAAIARGTRQARDARTYRRLISGMVENGQVRRALRLFAGREKLRIAVRELLPHAGSDVDVTARELSDLADVCAEVALAEALAWADARFGVPIAADEAGERRCPISVIGMGKLGGRELNAGSDVDLLVFYETDEGFVRTPAGAEADVSLHEYFTRVAQRFVATLDEPTEDGNVWRVDLRLRPEGSKGPLVNALAAAERYYETWGRTWERAALVRARPIAGDLDFGARLLASIAPFVWRRTVDPRIADEIAALLTRARAEAEDDVERDLKIGRGGIREVEFFAQSLQLVWGGKEPAVRSTNTLDALRRLRAHGYVTDREGREMADAYLVLRRLEHRIQFATGLQTHAIPEDRELLDRIGRSLGFASGDELTDDLARTRGQVSARYASLATEGGARRRAEGDLARLFVALDAKDEQALLAWLPSRFGQAASPDLARHVFALARRPDAPLGAITRDDMPEFVQVLVEALVDAADPEQATRLMAAFFARFVTPTVYARALAQEPRALRRLASLFGASAYLGSALVAHPELLDRLLFGRGAPDVETARGAVRDDVAALPENDHRDPELFVGALRRAKQRVTMEVGLADLAGDLSTRASTLALSALADATLDAACAFALAERGMPARGLAVIAMGKLGGREIGYGSDLDVFFVYEEPKDEDAGEKYIRAAQRVLRLASMPHDDGPGYELDTRLRPSGNQGLLVVSIDAFARYHQQGGGGEDWERQALVKARACAGDPELGARVIAIAHAAAYERGATAPEKLHHLRTRMAKELARERLDGHPLRFDLKLGKGGLVDVEFAVQWLQMKHGADPRVRTTETEVALAALETCGYLDAAIATQLREGYRFLRRLEQRLRVLHGTSAQLLEEGAPGLAPLARRMGMRDGPRGSAAAALLARYQEVARDVRAAYLTVLGVAG